MPAAMTAPAPAAPAQADPHAARWCIRPAGAGDSAALALVGAATFLETYAGWVDGQAIVDYCPVGHSAEAYRGLLADGAQAWLAAADPGGAPIGYALICRPDLEAAAEGDWELRRIYVLSRFQGAGIADALMAAALSGAAGQNRLLLGVKEDNHRALRFYRRHGFTEIGTRQFNVGDKTYGDFVLAKSL